MQSFTADGNFKADQLIHKNAAEDVHLTTGEGFMTNKARYQSHLDIAVESEQVCDLQ